MCDIAGRRRHGTIRVLVPECGHGIVDRSRAHGMERASITVGCVILTDEDRRRFGGSRG